MSWFRRRLNRWRNYFSDGDYAGSHGGSSGSSGGGSTGGDGAASRSATEFAIHADRMEDTLGPK